MLNSMSHYLCTTELSSDVTLNKQNKDYTPGIPMFRFVYNMHAMSEETMPRTERGQQISHESTSQ